MKFGRYLKDHSVEEWRRAYINYRLLKKAINKAALELEEGAEPVDPNRPGEGLRRQASPDELERDLERGTQADAEEDEDDDGEPDGVEGQRTSGPRQSAPRPSWPAIPDLDPTSPAFSFRVDPPIQSATATQRSTSGGNESQPSTVTTEHTASSMQHFLQSSSTPNPRPPARRDSRAAPTRQISIPRIDMYLTGAMDVNPKKWRTGFPPTLSLPELLEILPPACKRFFTLLDRELDRVETFFKERETEAIKRFDDLQSQWKELASHKKEFQAFQKQEIAPRVFAPIISKVPTSLPGSKLVRRTLASRPTAAPTDAEAGPSTAQPNKGTMKVPLLVRGRPEQYTSAKAKLKLATFEFYRSLGLLKSYKVLNMTGFAKALKKYEKTTRIPCAKAYKVKLHAAHFETSTKLDELIRGTEDAFATVFEHGDRKKALERLRQLGNKKMHHFTAWRSGVLFGLALPLLIEGLIKSSQASTRVEIPYWQALLQLFGAMFLPVLFAMLFYLNIVAWHYARINYVLIFELDIRTRLDMHQLTEIPAILFFVLSLLFWAAFNNFWPDHIEPSAYPLAFLVFALAFLLFPLPYFYSSARWWMIRSFCRVIMGGLVRVEFRDFFLGDELNSLYYCMYNLGFLYCTYSHRWPDNVQAICSTNETWSSAILASLPAVWRLGQSIRRYFDSDGLTIHLLNAGKYTASIAYYFAYFGWRIGGSDGGWTRSLWLFIAITNSIYTLTWDLIMDWSLLRKNSRHFLLRSELGFKESTWTYYVAIVLDTLLRFSWVWYLAPGLPSVQLRGFIIALLEVFRRIMWNAIRVESEHIGNVDGYRVTRDVPLPYIMPGATTERQPTDDDLEDETATRKTRLFKFIHTLHDGIVKDFTPLTQISLPTLRPMSDRSRPSPRPSAASRKAAARAANDGDSSAASADEEDDDEAGDGGSDSDADAERKMAEELDRAEEMQDAARDGVAGVVDGERDSQRDR
ncbi:hypothetical protein RQP46_002340 [Phenoliferia psychrophenolica]